jgi:hypothetical protein
VLVALLIVGGGLRVVLAFETTGVGFDIRSLEIVHDKLRTDPANVYDVNVTSHDGSRSAEYRWPYAPGYFPWILAAHRLSTATDTPFHGWIKLPAIAADLAIALLVVWFLGSRAITERRRLTAGALVLLGPSFIAVSGYHGQIDSVAIAPAVAAVVAWATMKGNRRAVVAGLLLGLGAVMKTVPIVLVFALLPMVTSRREGLRLIIATAAIPALALVPFLLATPHATLTSLRYAGVPGLGGLSLIVQPSLADLWLLGAHVSASDATLRLLEWSPYVEMAGVAIAAGVVLRTRPSTPAAAVTIWLGVFAFASNLFFQYAVWLLPFLLLCNCLRAVAVLQALLLGPMIVAYSRPHAEQWLANGYKVVMIGLWAVTIVAFVRWARGLHRSATFTTA